MSVIEITSDAKCKHCKYHTTDYIRRKDGSEGRRIIGYCTFTMPQHPCPASTLACDYFIPYWQPLNKQRYEEDNV